jgi:glycerate dehydrogenase
MTSATPKVVFLDRLAIRTPLRTLQFVHEWVEYETTRPDEVLARLEGATIAITNRVSIGREVIQKLPVLRLVAVSATGYECIDVEACKEAGIVVTNLRDWSTYAVAEHAFAMILSLRRQLLLYREAVGRGEWQSSNFYGVLKDPLPSDLYGNTLGIIGFGSLGKRIAHLGSAFGMQTLVAARKGQEESHNRSRFEEVLERSDVLCITCPLTPETRDLINVAELAAMKPTVVLINCARGGILNEVAVSDALRNGRIGGLGTDVLSNEPPRQGNPLLELSLPNLIVTPHMAFASNHALASLAEQLLSNIESFVQGDRRNVVS